MPAHADAAEGLKMLKDAGFRMATLTNSLQVPSGTSPLENANLDKYFELQFSIEAARAYKPAQVVYHMVAQELDVPPQECCLVATHVWDRSARRARARRAAFSRGRAMPRDRKPPATEPQARSAPPSHGK